MTESEFMVCLKPAMTPLQKLAVKLAGADEADDVLQTALMLAWRFRDSYRPGTNFTAWAVTIVKNVQCSRARYRSCRPWSDALELLPDADLHARRDTEDVDVARAPLQLSDELTALLERIPPEQVRVLVLRANGWDLDQIAEMERTTAGAIKRRLNRARTELRRIAMEEEVKRRA